MSYQPFEDLEFGGVDSRSNPLNMPQNRMLRCLNWAPKQGGSLELRHGYTTFTTSAPMGGVIHSMIPYSLWNGTRYIIVAVGTNLYSVAMSDGTKTTPTVKDTAIASSAKWESYAYNNRIYAGNGTDQKWFDGTAWRDNGLPALTEAQVRAISVQSDVREISQAEASAVTLTATAAATPFPAATTGIGVYCSFFVANRFGPATIPIGAGRLVMAAGDKIAITGLPNIGSSYKKLFAITFDGGANAYFCIVNTVFGTAGNRASGVTHITSVAHGFSSGDIVAISATTDATVQGIFQIVVDDVDHFHYDQTNGLQDYAIASIGSSVITKLFTVAGTATTADIIVPYYEGSILANSQYGLAATSVGGSQPGYQFYAAIYNPTAGGHVGNRVAIGPRLAPSNNGLVIIGGLPDFSSAHPEWEILIGRTGDAGELPYALMDSSGNWQAVGNGITTVVLPWLIQDSNSELPTNNGVIPAACDKFAVVGDYVYAATSSDATIRRSGSQVDANTGDFVGDPAQSWSPTNITTFPTGETPNCLAETDLQLFAASQTNCAILTDLNGIPTWAGPWPVGAAGKRAAIKTPYGFFWLSGQGELATLSNGAPVGVSDEYLAGELAKLDPARYANVELSYFRDVTTDKDEIRIEGFLTDGTPYTVVHSFRLRDTRSQYGQGFASQYQGPLASAFTLCRQFNSAGRLMVFAGGSNGYLYQLYTGANDAGSEYDADSIMVFNVGVQRPSVPFLDWWGDGNVIVSYGKSLQTTPTSGQQFSFEPLIISGVQGSETEPRYRAKLTRPEIQKCYIRLQLTSHSADGDLTLNDPPHCPLEKYGRIWDFVAAEGSGSGL